MKKKVIVVVVCILMIIGCGILFLDYQNKEKNTVLKIKNSYHEIVSTIKPKKIYIYQDSKYQEVGTLEKDTILFLEDKKVKNSKDIYYKINNSNYYITYQDIEKKDNYQVDDSFDNYVATIKIKTNPTNLYQNDSVQITLDQVLDFDVLFHDDDKYYVKFLDNIYWIQDSYQLSNQETDTLKDISILNLDSKITVQKLTTILDYLKENNYKSITVLDFKRWVEEKASLENNQVLLLSHQELDNEKKDLLEKYSYKVNTNFDDIFVSGDSQVKVGDNTYYQYDIYNTTSIDRIKDMLNGIKETRIENQQIAVLNYHFFYDSSLKEECNEIICIDTKNFRKQLDYLKENNYKILTMEEFNDWLDKKITLPKNSVLITVDDGAMGTSFINGNKLIPILEEYQIPASLFLITGWWDINNYRSNYLEVYSHGEELHHNNYCKNGKCGYKSLLLSKEEMINDLELSVSKTNTRLAFCYPFYQKNDTMVEALKESGFSVAFVGGNKKAKQTDSKYQVPRYIIYKNTSLESFIKMVSN